MTTVASHIGAALLALSLLTIGPCVAQKAPAQSVDPKACASGERLRPGETSPQAPSSTENLSDKLARTDGVVCPPNVDPEIKAPTPEVGKMPVIPPPGSPGGDPTVRPK